MQNSAAAKSRQSCLTLSDPMDCSLVGCSPWGCEELDTTERLPFHFSLSCTTLEKETLYPFATTEGNQKSGNWRRGDDPQASANTSRPQARWLCLPPSLISLKCPHLFIPTPPCSGQDPLWGVVLSGWWPEWRQGVPGRSHTRAVAPGAN